MFLAQTTDTYTLNTSGVDTSPLYSSTSSGNNNATPSSTGTPWYANILAQGLSLYQQVELQKTNLDRAKQGLPPLTAAQYGATIPTAQVQVGLSSGTKTALYLGAGGVLLIGLAIVLKKRKR